MICGPSCWQSKRDDFVRCLTEKMLIYALGRGLEYYDQCAVDRIKRRRWSKTTIAFRDWCWKSPRAILFRSGRENGVKNESPSSDFPAYAAARRWSRCRVCRCSRRCAPAQRAGGPRRFRQAARADGVPVRRQRHAHAELDARENRRRFRRASHAAAAGPVSIPADRAERPDAQRSAGAGRWRGRPRAQCVPHS